jgi:hypothetical protein
MTIGPLIDARTGRAACAVALAMTLAACGQDNRHLPFHLVSRRTE